MATVTIQKRKRKKRYSYLVSYKETVTGKKKHFKAFSKFKEAQQTANDLRAILDSGKLPERKDKKLVLMTFEQVAESLKKEWKIRLNKNDLSSKTCQDYCIWLNVLIRTFGKRLLCQITKVEVEDYIGARACDYSSITSNKYLSIFKKVFNHGIGLRAVIFDPVDEIPYLDEKNHERNTFLLPHHLDELVEASRNTRAKFYMPAIIYLGAEHGASKQEIICLKRRDVNFEFGGKGLIKLYRTKNKRERVEYLMPRTGKALQSWLDHLDCKRKRDGITKIKSDRVFCRIDGTPIKCFNRAWWHALDLAGIKDFHFHDLRHTFCSNLILSGGNLKDAKEMIGHSDISMTDRYSHLTGDHRLRKQNQLAEHYAENGKMRVR
jgi:site-specific recombinase XerD